VYIILKGVIYRTLFLSQFHITEYPDYGIHSGGGFILIL
jgi:hypothetical protein